MELSSRNSSSHIHSFNVQIIHSSQLALISIGKIRIKSKKKENSKTTLKKIKIAIKQIKHFEKITCLKNKFSKKKNL